MEARILGVGLRGPGLDSWEAARAVLAGTAPYQPGGTAAPAPSVLSANERRRASLVVRLALGVAEAACAQAGIESGIGSGIESGPEAGAMRLVFASANGDGATVHAILEALTSGDGLVSPTLFHNSVHNAAAGYWAIASRSRQAVTCLGCHDATFPAALLKAAAEVAAERQPVLLCLADAPLPPPLHVLRPTEGVFGAAFVLAPAAHDCGLARLAIDYRAEPCDETAPDPPALAALARANPAARALGLLQALARARPATLRLGYLDGHLALRVDPCSTAPASPR